MKSFEDILAERKEKREKGSFEYSKFDALMSQRIGEKINERLTSVSDYTSSAVNAYKSRFFDEDGKYINSYRDDTESALEGFSSSKSQYDSDKEYIKTQLEKYGGYYDEDYVNNVLKGLDNIDSSVNSIYDAYKYDHENMSKFKNEDEFKAALASQAEDERLLNINLEDLSNKISWMEGVKGYKDELVDINQKINNGENPNIGYQVSYDEIEAAGGDAMLASKRYEWNLKARKQEILQKLRDAGYNPGADGNVNLSSVESTISALNRDYRQAERLQKTKSFYDTIETADFFEKSKYNPIVTSNEGRYEEINQASSDSDRYFLDDKEVQIYNYVYNTHGEDKAEEFFDLIEDYRNQREAETIFKELEDKWFLEYLFQMQNTGNRFVDKISGIFEDDYVATTTSDFLSGMIDEDLEDVGFKVGDKSIGQIGFDVVTTTSDMIPAILAGTAATAVTGNPVVGAGVTSVVFGAGAYGDANRQMLHAGYSDEEAHNYATLVGASEAGLSMLLGTVSKGTGASRVIDKLTGGIKKGWVKASVGLSGKMASEFTEEALQEVLDPFWQNMALYADNGWDDIEWGDVLYAGMLGAMSAGLLDGGVSSVRASINTYRAGKAVKRSGLTSNLVKFGNSLSADSVAHKLADKITENTGAYKIGKLLHEAGADSLSQTNMADIVSALEAKGVAPEHANTIAEWMNNTVMGVELTEKQQMALDSNPVIAQVYNEVLLDSKSTVNQRMTGYKQLVNDVNRGNALAQKRKKVAKVVEKAIKDKYDEQAKEVKNKVSDEGKTMVDGTEVTLNGIDHIEVIKDKDGRITDRIGYVKVVDANGNERVEKATDVEFSTRSEAVLYDAFVNMDIDLKHFDAFVKNFNEADFDGNVGDAAIQYALGFRNAYRYGWINEQTKVADDVFASKLTESVRNIAFKLGKESIETKTETKQRALDTAVNEREESGKGKVRTNGKLHMEGVKSKTHTVLQKAGIGLARRLTNLGMDVYLFESHKNAKGDWVDDRGELVDNGFYRASDGSIHIDINAGQRDVSIMAFTLSHELVHFMRDNAPREFKILADLLIEWYGKKGVSVNKQIEAIMDSEGVDWDTAYEEFVAKSCESFLTDSNIADRILELKNKDEKTHGIVREKVLKFLNWMKSLFRNVDVESEQGAFVRKFQKEIDHLYDAFYNALASASETFQWREKTLDPKSIVVNEATKKPHSVRDNSNGKVYNEKNTTKEGLIRGEPRQETREAFLRRAVQTVLQVETRGKTAYGYRRSLPSDVKERSRQIERELKRLGVPSVIYDRLEVNRDGITTVRTSEATTVRGDAVYINNAVLLNAKEVAGHEAYHFWDSSEEMSFYTEVLTDNIDFSSKHFGSFISKIGDGYSLDDAEIGSKQWEKLMEELGAYISGFIHSGNNVDLVKPFIRNFSEVESAWNALVNSKSKNGKRDSQETESSNDEGIKKSTRRNYSYDALVSKPDMPITTITGKVPTNRADLVATAKRNAAKVGKANKDGSVSVHVNDVDADVVLTTHGLRHGLRRKQQMTKANGIVTLMAGEIIQNSIRVNELVPADNDVASTYILMGIARDTSGDVYIVRSVVNKYDNELVSMDALYAVNAKKELAVQKAPRLTAKPLSVTSSTISISNFLDYVNRYFPDVLPEDVLKHYGHTSRPEGELGESALYQRRGANMSNRSILVNALESATQHESEAKRLAEYKAKIDFCFFPWGSPWGS